MIWTTLILLLAGLILDPVQTFEGTMLDTFLSIKRVLLGSDGDLYWANLKDAEMPVFRGKVVSASPNRGVSRIRLAIEKDGVVDVSLVSVKPMCKSIAIGAEIEFVGLAREFTKEPFLFGLEAVEVRGCPK